MKQKRREQLIEKHDKEKLDIYERFFKIMDARDEIYLKLVDQMMTSITLKEDAERMAKKIRNQEGWINELESSIPRIMLDKIRQKHRHMFHLSESDILK